MRTSFAAHPLLAGASAEELEGAAEGLEKYLLTKLYDRTFGVADADKAADAALGRRLAGLAFLPASALEVDPRLAEDAGLASAAAQLAKMNNYKV